MPYPDVLRCRLRTQHVAGAPLATPDAVVHWLGAVQSQDYAAARWAVGQRVGAATAATAATVATADEVDRAFNRGAFLRTHVMRPTWHFVAPGDLRWLLALTAPRVNALSAYYYRAYELDGRVFEKSQRTLVELLQGGRCLTRREIVAALEKKRILRTADSPHRGAGLLMRAELDAVICSGPRQGKQFTYALLEERVPRARTLSRDQARAELTRRFFLSHGPATVKDFAWWSGLTVTDCRAGVESVQSELEREALDGQEYWQGPSAPRPRRGSPTAYMLPAYDETLIAYRDGREFFKPFAKQLTRDFGQLIVVDGRTLGSWRRREGRGGLTVHVTPFAALTAKERRAIDEVVARYGRFHELDATVAYEGR